MIKHGEYKMPGGKLIAVEFVVEALQLRHVVVTGDFFLYPEEALPLLAGALEGAPANMSAAQYAARIRPALADVELLGASADGLATAVRRALEDDEAPEAAGDAG